MKIKLKRFDASLRMPEYKTGGAAAFDLPARETVTIPARGIGYVPLNVAIEIPKDHFLLIAARSSTHKKGLMMANGIGIIDPDFSGNEDEIRAACYNFTDAPVIVEQGERIAQGLFVATVRAEWDEVVSLENETRGGFGTTGK